MDTNDIFVSYASADRERVDVSAHQVAGRGIDEPVARDRVVAGERGGDDSHLVVAALAGASMAGMAVRIIGDRERFRVQCRQPLAQQFDGFRAQAGRTFLNGLTVTFS